MNTAEYLTDHKLKSIFEQFDLDGTGEITSENLKKSMFKFGLHCTDDEIHKIMT